ncbi:MAG: enoyl-CoA hydratase/isomerase family protein [Phycisphaerales bacterium]|nr:enoyl-CoA hydratase/isomerase family protein [Phycisphaerales bacterium]
MSDCLLTRVVGPVAELTLNRPGRRNALSADLIGQLTEALRACDASANVRVVLLTGTPPAFCAGLDLHDVLATPTDLPAFDTRPLLALYETLATLGEPTIAVVNGPATAGGAALALACDIVIAGRSAQFGFPGIRQGLAPAIVIPLLLRAAGPCRAAYMLLTGELLSAEQAAAWGLVAEVVDDDRLADRALEMAELIAGHPADAARRMKVSLARFSEGLGAPGAARRADCERMMLSPSAHESLARLLGTNESGAADPTAK